MKNLINIFLILVIFSFKIFSQGFEVKASGVQTFSFESQIERNQATFFSTTPFEEINGLTTVIHGKVSFDVKDFVNTLEGEITIPVASLRTGISKMEEDLRSSAWLDEEKYPIISFKIKKVSGAENLEPNKIKADVTGDFTVHGVTKEITAETVVTYLDENEQTKTRMPGDLLGVTSDFKIQLSDFNVDNLILGKRVSNNIDIKVNIVGSNKF